MEGGQNDHVGPIPGSPEFEQRPESHLRMRLPRDHPSVIEHYEAGVVDGKAQIRPLTIDGIAKTCHEVNRVWCEAHNDTSQASWEASPDWQRESALKGVAAALEGVSDEELHQLWCDTKHQDGWVYGEVKDAVAKTHPCLVPYDQLPLAQQVKDTLFRTVVESLGRYLP